MLSRINFFQRPQAHKSCAGEKESHFFCGLKELADFLSLTIQDMFYVYLLKSKKDSSLYIGFYTSDLRAKIMKHHGGMVRSTKNLRPLELIYYEAYKSKKDALIREKRLKRFAKGYASLKGRLKYSLMLNEG